MYYRDWRRSTIVLFFQVYRRKFNSKKRAPNENSGEPEKFVNTYKHQLIGNETHYVSKIKNLSK